MVAFTADPAPVYPDAAFSVPSEEHWINFQTMAGVGSYPLGTDRAMHFDYNERILEPPSGGPGAATVWRFRCKPGTATGTVLALDERIRFLPQSIRLTVLNRSDKPVRLALQLQEMPWEPLSENRARAWHIAAPAEAPPGAQALLTYDLTQAKPDRNTPDRPPLPPFIALTLLPESIEKDTFYEIVFKDIAIHYYDLAPVTCGLSALERITAGTQTDFKIDNAPSDLRECSIELARVMPEGRYSPVLWRIPLAPATPLKHVESIAPLWLTNGQYRARLVCGPKRLAECDTEVVGARTAQPSFACAERALWKDRPTVMLDKLPFCWNGYSSYEYQPGNVTEFGRSGANLLCIPVDAGRHVHHHAARPVLLAPDTFDFGQLEERVAFSLQANPNARLFLRVSLAPPLFWLQAHPEARALIRTDQGDLPHEETVAPQVSHASKRWREDETVWLRALMDHCRKQPWGTRLMGVWLTSGVTEEWFAWGSNDGLWSDYNPEMQAAFRDWQQARGWEPSDIPDPSVRDRKNGDIYPDDAEGRVAAAYARFASEQTADTIAHFARVVKEVSDRQLLVGVFYGYLFQLAGEPRQSTGNHYALRSLLDNPDVDLFSGIPLLNYRTLRDGFDSWVVPDESLRTAGKLYCNENDLFSWLHPILWHTEYDGADPRGGAIALHRRVFANDIIHGGQRQWFSLMSSWHHDEALQQEFSRLITLHNELLPCDRTPVEQVAFVVDDTSFAWIPPASKLGAITVLELYKQCGRAGAPVGAWMLSDLDSLPDRVRFVVVTQAHAPAPADLEKLRRLIEKGGRTILLVGPVGLVNPATQAWDHNATATLTGLPVIVEDAESPGKTLWSASGAVNRDWGAISPRARLEGGPAPLLHYADGAAAGAERELSAGGHLVWCGMPPLSPEVLRGWMERVGVHCFAPVGCVVQASNDLVSVTADAPGDLALHWTDAVQIRDVYNDWTGAGRDIVCPFSAGQTRLFRVSPEVQR